MRAIRSSQSSVIVFFILTCIAPWVAVEAQESDQPALEDNGCHGFQVFAGSNSSAFGSIIDSASNTVVGTFPQGSPADSIAITPNGKIAYVTNRSFFGPGTITVVDLKNNAIVTTIATPTQAFYVAFTPNGHLAFVTSQLANSVFVIDVKENILTDVIPVGRHPDRLAVTPDGRRVYVANAFSNSVSVIDTKTRTVVDTITAQWPVFGRPLGVAITPDGAFVYVTNQNSATVSVIETASDTIVATIKIPFAPQEIAITPDGSLAFVAVGFSNQVTVIDVASNQVVESIPFGSAGSLQSLAISTDGTRAYFAFAPHQILVMDTATRAVVSFVEIGPNGPPAIAVRPNDEAEQSCSNQ